MKNPNIEAAKNIGRNGILAASSSLLIALGDWLIGAILNVHAPADVLLAVGGLVYAGFVYLDKYLHQRAKNGVGKGGLVNF